MLKANCRTSWNSTEIMPQIHSSSYVDESATIIGDVRVGKVKSVQCIERGPNLVFDKLWNLIGSQELCVDGGDIPRTTIVSSPSELVSGQERIDGCVTVAMQNEWDIQLINSLDHLIG